MTGVAGTDESTPRRLSNGYWVLILLTGLFWVLFWAQFEFGKATDAVVVENSGDLICTVEWQNPWTNRLQSDEIDCDAEMAGDLVNVLAHPWPFRGGVSNLSDFGWLVGIFLGLETLVVLGVSVRRLVTSDVRITVDVAPPAQGAATLALVKAPIGRRQTITIGDASIAITAPGVLRTGPLLVPKSQIHAISPTTSEEDAEFLRPPEEIFLCPNQYASPNVGIVLKNPIAVPTKWGWGLMMLPRRSRKAGTRFDVIGLSVDQLPSLMDAAGERRYPVTSDLTRSIIQVIGAETDPSRVHSIHEQARTDLNALAVLWSRSVCCCSYANGSTVKVRPARSL